MNLELMEFKEIRSQLIKGVLAKLYNLGMQVDTKALKYFLDFHAKELNSEPVVTNTQDNYIRINNLMFTRELISGMPINAIEEIEAIVIKAQKVKAITP